ncbi:MAG: adenosylmethionine--8-amino-7-oxononanoate transaminase [Puniceicoccales bacterium]|jgi:adenosylmethionine-8-amino-7-oxononanoate aminotransferase|nr:adenosylmethionine--8-amino-7-oxononanoate transaminase [Puniceicoccales bacterium]
MWRPFTQEKTAAPPIKIVRGEGVYLFSETGEKYVDMISSWWVNIHGHGNKEIAETIYAQAKTLEHVICTKFSHDPAETLVENLKKLLPPNLSKFFFSDNGSTSVEVALKMAYQYFRNGMEKRNLFLCLEGGYHGDTFGAMSVAGKSSKYHSTFSELFFNAYPINVPENYEGVEDIEEQETRIIEEWEQKLLAIGNRVCAIIVEPLLQGAAGMKLYRPEFLEKLVHIVRRYGILVIFDEVMTGFYRTGKMFAMDYGNAMPDFICLSKGITGGFLPLGMTVTTEKVYDAFLSDDPGKTFTHGHSYTANPISCAAANKSLEILLRRKTFENIKMIEEFHRKAILKNVRRRRTIGTVSAFDINSSEQRNHLIESAFREGIFLRPLGNTIYFLPPYCIVEEDLDRAYGVVNKFL